MDLALLWIPATLVAAAAQTGRNAMQRGLVAGLGTVGATGVRFLYGFPFALLFLCAVVLASGAPPPPTPRFLAFVAGGALAQMLATGLMLRAMQGRSFAVATAYTKTEPVQAALFGLAVLGDPLEASGAAAIGVATGGVVLMALRPGERIGSAAGLGLAAGGCFALSAVGYRGAILALGDGSFLLRATTTLAYGLGLQTGLLLAGLFVFDRARLAAIGRAWRESLAAGALGAVASQFWFIGFALTSVANVRTLGLAEVLFAQALQHRLFGEGSTRRERAGMALVAAGVAGLLMSAR